MPDHRLSWPESHRSAGTGHGSNTVKFSILEDGRSAVVDATIDGGRVRLSPDDLERTLGWTLKPQGFCRGEVCMPVSPSAGVVGGDVVRGDAVDLAAFAELLARPIVVDLEAGAACLGDSARERGAIMRGGMAPDFTLPDLSGHSHSLGDYRGRKALLIAWASW